MAWRRIGDKPLSTLLLTRFTDTYMLHYGEMGYQLMRLKRLIELISYWKKWPPFRRRRFQTHFREYFFLFWFPIHWRIHATRGGDELLINETRNIDKVHSEKFRKILSQIGGSNGAALYLVKRACFYQNDNVISSPTGNDKPVSKWKVRCYWLEGLMSAVCFDIENRISQ